jgi:hypothetical protein
MGQKMNIVYPLSLQTVEHLEEVLSIVFAGGYGTGIFVCEYLGTRPSEYDWIYMLVEFGSHCQQLTK